MLNLMLYSVIIILTVKLLLKGRKRKNSRKIIRQNIIKHYK